MPHVKIERTGTGPCQLRILLDGVEQRDVTAYTISHVSDGSFPVVTLTYLAMTLDADVGETTVTSAPE